MIFALLIVFGFLVAVYAVDYDIRRHIEEIDREYQFELEEYARLNSLIDDLSPSRSAEH